MTGTLTLRAMDWLTARGLDAELCEKLGLQSSGSGDREALVYPFYREGKIVGRKFRPLSKIEGAQRFWREKGDTICAFNEDCLRDDSLVDQPVIITEGQDDCIACIQAGFPRTISVPDGAPERPVENIDDSRKYDWLDAAMPLLKMARAKTIILAVDGDSAGAALLHDLSYKLGRSRCQFVTYPKRRGSEERLKDMNEVLEGYGSKGVSEVISRAAFIRVEGVYAMSELPPLPESIVYRCGFEALHEHFRIRLGDMSVWTGVPSHGKSTALNDILCRVIEQYGIRVGWASFEQEPQRDHRRALRSWFCEDFEFKLDTEQLGSADQWIDKHHRFIVASEEEDPTLEWLLDKMEAAVIQHGCKIVVIDPWNEAVHDRGPGENETDYTNRSLRTLKRFAKRFQVHVAVVAHPTKLRRNEDGTYPIPSLYDVSGSAAWYNKPDQGLIVHRLTAEETIIKVQKSRYHEILGKPGIVKFHYTSQTRRYVEVERNVPDDDGKPNRAKRREAE